MDGLGWNIKSELQISLNFMSIKKIYIPNYIYILKNCHQHSYGFQNFMTSWGSWSKISKLKQVRDFFIFGSKLVIFFTKL